MTLLSVLLPVLLLAVTACDQPAQGTAVGNPGLDTSDLDEDGVLRLGLSADAALGVDLASLALDRIELLDCDGGQQDIDASAEVDLFAAEPFPLPAGAWCQLGLRLDDVDEPLILAGLTDGGTTWRVALDPGVLTIDQALYVDGQEVDADIDLDALFTASQLEAMGTEVDIRPDDAQALDWSDALLDHVTVAGAGGDAGGDAADAMGDASADAGCTCTTGGAGGSWLLVTLLALLRRRRSDPALATTRGCRSSRPGC